MIAGAFYGLDAIPVRWLRKLHKEVKAEVEEQAVKLVELSPWAAQRARQSCPTESHAES
jgi:ADP-ribosyl-[dinitrogen reductase] hydrolase